MSFKVATDTNPGDTQHFGAPDLNKITTMLNGVTNVATVPMNSIWQWYDQKLKFRNPAGTFYLTIRTPAITENLDLNLPAITASDTILCETNLATIQNKVISAADNVLFGTVLYPDIKKTGMIQAGPVPGGNSGFGLLYGFVDNPGLPIKSSDPTAGVYWRYSSGTTTNTSVGISCSDVFLRREWECRFKTKFRVPSTTGTSSTRLYVGISTDITINAVDTPGPLAADDSGVIVGWRSTDANFQVFRNSGTNTSSQTAIVVDTGVPKTTAPRTIDIFFTNDGESLTVVIGDPATNSVVWSDSYTTNLPQAGFGMSPSIILQNTGAVDRKLDLFHAYCEENV